MNFYWHDVIVDFGSLVEEPGTMSSAAINVLADELGTRYVPREVPRHEAEAWADRVGAVAEAGLPALVARLDHPSPGVRRALAFVLSYVEAPELPTLLRAAIEVEPDAATTIGLLVALGRYPDRRRFLLDLTACGHSAATRFGAAFALLMRPSCAQVIGDDPAAGRDLDDRVIEALTLCVTDEIEPRLQELPWMDPEWDSVVSVVGDRLRAYPDASARWLARMLMMLRTGECPGLWSFVCCRHAADLRDRHPSLAAPLGPLVGDLLSHPQTAIRRGALHSIDHWLDTPDTLDKARHLDRVAAALDAPGLSDLALGVLVRQDDARCLPALRRLLAGPLDTGTQGLLRAAAPFADALMPDLRARLSTDPAPPDALLLLGGITAWTGLRAALPELRQMRRSLNRRREEWRAALALDQLQAILDRIAPDEHKPTNDEDRAQ